MGLLDTTEYRDSAPEYLRDWAKMAPVVLVLTAGDQVWPLSRDNVTQEWGRGVGKENLRNRVGGMTASSVRSYQV